MGRLWTEEVDKVRIGSCSSSLYCNLTHEYTTESQAHTFQDQAQDPNPRHDIEDQAQDPDPPPRDFRYCHPSSFDLGQLRVTLKEDKIEFGRWEIALRLCKDGSSLSHINQRLRLFGANILSSDQYNDLKAMDRKGRKLDNFKSLKKELNEELPGWHPHPIPPDGDFLRWWVNMVRLSSGEQVPLKVKDVYGHLTNFTAVIF